MQDQSEETPWGAKLNRRSKDKTKNCPAWANPAQREKWDERGLVLWDHEARQITRLWAAHALQILDYLRTNEEWEKRCIEIGEPATRIVLDHPEQEPTQVLMDKMTLTPDRLRELYALLDAAEQELQQMQQEDEEDCRRRIAKVYDFLIQLGQQRKEKKGN